MKNNQAIQRGGALVLAAVMCLTGLVGCGTKKPNKDQNQKPGTTQGMSTKKPAKANTGKKAGKAVGQKDDKGAAGDLDKIPAKTPAKDAGKDAGTDAAGKDTNTDAAGKDDSRQDDKGADKKGTTQKTSQKTGGAKIPVSSKAPAAGKAGGKGGK